MLFFNDTATTEIYSLSLRDALPILRRRLPRCDALKPTLIVDAPGARAGLLLTDHFTSPCSEFAWRPIQAHLAVITPFPRLKGFGLTISIRESCYNSFFHREVLFH